MTLLGGALVLVGVTAVAVAAMLLVRRKAPDGSRFQDGDRASGVFGVLATGFSVLLGFIIFLAFSSYDGARAAAEDEATVVAQQVETAQFFDDDVSAELTAELVCYGRSVAGVEWDRLQSGSLGDATVNPWGAEMFETISAVEPATASEQSAYDRWLDQTAEREQDRNDRVHGLSGVVPTPLWVVLYLLAGVIFVYMLFFADAGEGAGTQAVLMGSVAIAVTSLLLLLAYFNQPFQADPGGLEPVAMQRALRIVDNELDVADVELSLPCDADGRAR